MTAGPATRMRTLEARRLSRLLVIDGAAVSAEALDARLARTGWDVRRADGPLSPNRLSVRKIDALVLDPTRSGEDGWRYLGEVAATVPMLALVVCAERSTVTDRVRGLRLGADDWVAASTPVEEIAARIETVSRGLRRGRPPGERPPLRFGRLEIRPSASQAFFGGVALDLTPREFEVLHLLATAGGRVLSREEIYAAVWGYSLAEGDRIVDMFIRKVRRKLELGAGRRLIDTHFGIGYRFAGDAEEDRIARPQLPRSREDRSRHLACRL